MVVRLSSTRKPQLSADGDVFYKVLLEGCRHGSVPKHMADLAPLIVNCFLVFVPDERIINEPQDIVPLYLRYSWIFAWKVGVETASEAKERNIYPAALKDTGPIRRLSNKIRCCAWIRTWLPPHVIRWETFIWCTMLSAISKFQIFSVTMCFWDILWKEKTLKNRLRRGRDSNSRYQFTQYDGLANRCLQPLGHLSRSSTNS